MRVDIRTVTDDDLPAFHATEAVAFGSLPDEDGLAEARLVYEAGRAQAAFADEALVGTTNAYSFAMTVPGGATIRVAGVSDVTVAATHRRRGILRSLMGAQLDDIAARGEVAAVLSASEAGIYGRFGYGLAQSYQSWSIDTVRTSFREPVGDDLVLRRLERDEATQVLPAIYDEWRVTRAGAMSHSPTWWTCLLGERDTWKGGGQIFIVVAGPAGRAPTGYAIYLVDNDRPPGEQVVHVRNVVATDDVVRARLWRYLLELDLVGTVVAENVALDDPLKWWLTDPRRVQTTKLRDYLFVRLLDVPTALTARRYDHDGELVIEVTDAFRPAASGSVGRFRLEHRDGEVSCDLTSQPPDLVLDVSELGSLYLGGVTARELVAARRIVATSADVVRRADELFGWPVAPFCITRF